MSTSLPRPGVQVIQQFRAVSPTVITPTLVPCVVGVCKQIVELLVSDGAGGQVLNLDAQIVLPAFFIAKDAPGSTPEYTGLDGLTLAVSINNGLTAEIVFADPSASGLTPATVVDQVNTQLVQLGVTDALAETVGTKSWQLATVGKGQFQSIVVEGTTSPAVLSAFGLGIGKTYVGTGDYNQYTTLVPKQGFPDPRSNLSELNIQLDTIRAFLSTGSGTSVMEALRTESFLRSGAVMVAAEVSTTTDITGLTYPTDIQGKNLLVTVDGGAQQTVAVPGVGAPANAAAFVAFIQSALTGATVTQVGTSLHIKSNTTGVGSSVAIGGASTLLTVLTFVSNTDSGANIAAVDDGNGDAVTPILEFEGHNFTAAATSAVLTGSAAPTLPPTADSTLILSDGGQPQVIVFTGAEATVTGATNSLQATIEAIMGTAAGGKVTVSASGGALRLTSSDSGDESLLEIIGGTALAELDPGVSPTIIAGASVRGVAHPPKPGDELWIDGVLYAKVNKVAPGGVVSRIKIDKQVVISSNVGQRFFIQAKNLTSTPTVGRPTPNLLVDLYGNVSIKHSMLRDFAGNPVDVRAPLFLTYQAVRKDTTALAKDPGILRFDDTIQLEQAIGPISADNPLALGLYFALLNAPGIQVTGLGVDEVASDAPFGTVEAFTRSAEFLEGYEVYGIATLTQDESVGQVFNTHVQFMSQPEQRGERVVLWNTKTPTTALDTLVASGTSGDTLNTTVFDTKITNLSALLQASGVSPIGTIPVSAGVFLDLASDGKRYSIRGVNGSQVTVRTVAGDFPNGSNDDDYYAESVLPMPLIGELFSVRVRGAALVTVDGNQDKNAVADTVNALGQSFKSRRFWMTFPDRCAATLGGVEQVLPAFYLNAASVGAMGQQPPQQSFTNFPIAGFTRVLGSSDTFSEKQLDVMAGGGAYIFVQDVANAPVYARMALTTDLTSIETRTDSVTKVVDFTAKFMRSSIKNLIGRFNITQGFLDTLGTTVQGLFGFLVETGVLIGGNLDNIIQDEDNRDTVLLDTTLDVPIPCNYIKLTLLI